MRPLFALFIRSLREDSRAKLPPILRAALVLVILLIIWSNQRSFEYRAAPGREFFMLVMMFNTGFIALMALSIFSSAIAEEKEDDTLTLLRITNLSPLSILMGKGASRLFSALLLIAVQIPFTLLGIALGGVSMEHILFAYAVLGATTIFLCAVALAASVYCRTAMRAGFLTGTIIGILFFLLPFLAITTTLRSLSPSRLVASGAFQQFCVWIVEMNPIYALAMLFESPQRTKFVTEQIWIMLGGAAVFFLLAWALFTPCCADAGDTAGRPRKKKNGSLKPRRLSIGRPKQRPLVWKDWNFMIGGKPGFLLRLALAAAIYCGTYLLNHQIYVRYPSYIHEEYHWRQTSEMTLAFACMCAGLDLLLVTGRIFGVEYRQQTLSSLVALPIKAGRIIRHKILGCLPIFIPWLLLAMLGFAVHPRNLLYEFTEDTFHMRSEELAATLYVGTQSLLLLTTIVWFSLKIRRGALPAAIAIIGGWNIVFGLFADTATREEQAILLILGVTGTVMALAWMFYAVHQRIQAAAAEDS